MCVPKCVVNVEFVANEEDVRWRRRWDEADYREGLDGGPGEEKSIANVKRKIASQMILIFPRKEPQVHNIQDKSNVNNK